MAPRHQVRRALTYLSALGSTFGSSSSSLLSGGAPIVVGSAMVLRHGNFLRLERTAEPGNVQSEWDLLQQIAPDYAGTMADMAREALDGRNGPQRVLLLGLGGGTMAADLLCGGVSRLADWRLHVTAVESDSDVAQIAREYFIPAMFHEQPAAQERLSVVVADAIELVASGSDGGGPTGAADGAASTLLNLPWEDEAAAVGARAEGKAGARAMQGRRFDVILEDFAYESPGLLRAPFWRALRENFAARDATLISNTLYAERSLMGSLQSELQAAGWADVRQRVDRGLQALPGEATASWDPADWEPRDNMIFVATNNQ